MPDKNMQFSKIQTQSIMSNGKIITQFISDPKGLTKADFDKIDRDMVTAFGDDRMHILK